MAKIGVNQTCPCGSTKKFKKCCANTPHMYEYKEKRRNLAELKELNDFIRHNRLKVCMHPLKEECDSKIIRAHSIQESILDGIAQNGQVYMFDVPQGKAIFTVDLKRKGISSATTFQCFCKTHDQMYFRDIEIYNYQNTDKQNFLLAFRTFASEYYRVLEHQQMVRKSFELIPSLLFEPFPFNENNRILRELQECEEEYNIFIESISCQDYSSLSTFVFEFDFTIGVAASTSFYPLADFDGNFIQSDMYLSRATTKKVFFNIFPQNGKSFMVLSWFKKYDDAVKPFVRQLSALETDDFKNFINNTLCFYKNVVISPFVWDKLPFTAQKAYKQVYFNGMRVINGSRVRRRTPKKYLFRKPAYDLLVPLVR